MLTGTPPQARIYILIDEVGSRPDARIEPYAGKHLLYRFDTFTDIDVDLPIKGIGTASIMFNNLYDRFYDWNGKRFDDPNINKIQEEISLLKNLIQLNLFNPLDLNNRKDINKYIDKRVSTCETSYPIIPFGLMNRVFIDFQGRDGKWYAGFTGFISKISERTTKATGNSTITLTCYDFRRLLSMTPILLRKEATIWPNNEWYSLFEKSLETKMREYMNRNKISEGNTNIFGGMQPRDIFKYILDVMNFIYSNNGKSYWGPDNLWKETKKYSEFLGKGKYHIRSDEPTIEEYISTKGFYTDSLLGGDSDYRPYRQMIRDGFSLYGMSKEYALKIMEHIASMVLGYVFVDSVGNLKYELPKYNNFPHTVYKESDSEQKDGNGQYFHGPNYIIQDDSLISWNIEESEEPIISKVIGSRGFDLIDVDGMLDMPLNQDQINISDQEQQRFGFREFSTQTLYYGSPKNNEEMKKVFSKFLEAVIVKLNSSRKKLSVTFNQRPDFLLNRTLFLLEREIIALITKIHHTYKIGTSLTTVVSCEYCRKVGEGLPEPWKILEEQDSKISEQDLKEENEDESRYPFII